MKMTGALGFLFVCLLAGASAFPPGTFRLSCPLDQDALPVARYSDASDCSRYYICDWGVISHMQCPTGLFWAPSNTGCVAKDQSICAEAIPPPTEAPPPPPPTEAPAPPPPAES